jgi:hypothetical protein
MIRSATTRIISCQFEVIIFDEVAMLRAGSEVKGLRRIAECSLH